MLRKLLIGLACLSASPVLGDVHLVPNPNGALAGKNVVFSPGHGRMLDSNGTWWRFQRGVQFGIQEDIHTNEIFIEYIQRFLAGAGARVASCRERSFQANEVIVDSGHAGYSETGSWTASTSATDFYGSGYRWANTEATTTATATFTPDIPEAGRYPIYVWYTQSGNRALDARFEVHHTGGVTSVEVNQQIWGGGWVFLGDFFFDAGTGGKVVLANGGSDPTKFVIADAIRFGGGIGPSGEVRWREGAKSFLTYKGYPASNGEVSIRPVYGRTLAGGSTSAWRDDYVFVSLHTNAAGGTGTSAFSYSNGRPSGGGYSPGPAWYPSGLQGKSDQLRDAIRSQVVADIRALHDPAWRDRGGSPRNAGELREARNMPSTLLELAFHDFAGDAARLADPAFRHDSARAIYKGILRFFRGAGATVVPLTPSDLRVTNLGGGELRVSWNSVNDPLEPSAAATRFKVYLSRDGRGFNNGQIVTGSSMTLSGYSPGDRVFVRVAGLNAGGEGLATRIGGAQVGSGGAMLVVDGFDRAFTHTNTNYKAIWSHDYAVEHIDALGASAPTAPIDFAENEAVASGSVDLSNYELVDWLLGRESSVNRTFDPAEQGRVETYLRGGGALLATGSEIGWDLEAKAGGVAFLHDILGVDYVRDDAGVRVANTPTGSPFSNGGPIRLHDGTDGGYDAAFPDVLSPNGPGADVALSWETAGAPGAGVAQSTPYKVVVLGFPLESVVGTGRRRDLAGEAYRFLLPGGLGTTPTTGGTGSGGSPAGPNVPTTTAPGATSAPTAPPQTRGSRSGGGSSCSLGAQSGAGAPVSPTLLLLLLLALARVRRSSGDACPPGRVVSGRA